MINIFYNKKNMSKDNIQDAVSKNLEKYFRDLGEQPASNIYDMVVLAVEKPMIEMVMTRADSNQSQAADMLGINRNTLRKKLQQHGLLWLAAPVLQARRIGCTNWSGCCYRCYISASCAGAPHNSFFFWLNYHD